MKLFFEKLPNNDSTLENRSDLLQTENAVYGYARGGHVQEVNALLAQEWANRNIDKIRKVRSQAISLEANLDDTNSEPFNFIEDTSEDQTNLNTF